MHQARTWPSRRLQIGIIAVLAIGAVLTMLVPPLTKAGRAERLYVDSWFQDPARMSHVDSDARGPAVKYANKALELFPSNSYYQQALVWHSDSRDIPRILKEHDFDHSARRLAAGLMYTSQRQESIRQFIERIGNRNPTSAELVGFWKQQFTFADSLLKVDPDNGLAHFRKARILLKVGRISEALVEIKAGDRAKFIHSYIPDVPISVLDAQYSTSNSLIFDGGDIELFKPLARFLFGMARVKFEGGKPAEAISALEECCLMGVRLAELQPYSIKAFKTGRQLFKNSWTVLKPTYEAAGLKERSEQFAKVDEAFNEGIVSLKSANYSAYLVHKWPVSAFPWTINRELFISLLLLLGAAFWWIPPAVTRKLRACDLFCHIPWGTGWLARVLLYTYIPVFGIIMVTILFLPLLMTQVMNSPYAIFTELLVILPSLIVPGIAFKQLHREHDAKLGVRTGIFRFIFGSSASVKVWARKCLLTVAAVQVLFVICCGFFMTILYRPVFGALPWDSDRFMSERYFDDRAMVSRLFSDIRATPFMRDVRNKSAK